VLGLCKGWDWGEGRACCRVPEPGSGTGLGIADCAHAARVIVSVLNV